MAFFRPKQLLRAIRKFVAAKTWSESKRILEKHPELLSDETDAFLEHLTAEQADEDVIGALTQQHELLRRCRDAGLDAAFAHLIGADISSPPGAGNPCRIRSRRATVGQITRGGSARSECESRPDGVD